MEGTEVSTKREKKMLLTNILRDQDEVIRSLIDENKLLVCFKNASEWGPRALGNRSIIFDPRHEEAKQIVNEVKQREAYRPFACTVLKEHAHEYFDMLQLEESPWMSFAIQAKERHTMRFLHWFMQTEHVEFKQ